MKRLFSLSLIIILVLIAVFVFFEMKGEDPATDNDGTEATQNEDKVLTQQSYRLIATGDMIPHDTVNLRANESEDGYLSLLEPLAQLTSTADAVFCNQESPSAGEVLGISGYPTFNAPISFSVDLNRFGCNLINLSNNHVADKGIQGIDRTLDTWASLETKAVSGISKDQSQQDSVAVFEILGKKVAFVSFAEFSNNNAIPSYSLNLFSDDLVTKIMANARTQADFIIVSAHWGIEDQEEISNFQLSWGQRLADEGADLIIGTGPHVVQTYDQLSQPNGDVTHVYYSLGNALTTQLKLDELIGIFAVIDFDIANDQLTIKSNGVLPVYMHYEWTPAQASQEDLLERNNLQLVPLDQAQELLAKSLFTTSVASQTQRVSNILNQNIPVPILSSSDF